MSGYEARVVTVTHPFLQNPLAKVLAEAEAGGHQAVVPAVGLRESADDRPGHQSTVRENGQHHPRLTLVRLSTNNRSTALDDVWRCHSQQPHPQCCY